MSLAFPLAALGAPQESDLPMQERARINPRFHAFDAMDTADMPTGAVLARHDPNAIAWTEVSGMRAGSEMIAIPPAAARLRANRRADRRSPECWRIRPHTPNARPDLWVKLQAYALGS